MSNLNKLTGKVSLGKAFPFAFQQVLAMFVSNLVPIVIVCSAAGMSGDQILTFSQNAMIIAGIWVSFPPVVQSIFSQNVVAVIIVMSFLLNLVLPADMEDHNAR